MLSPSTFFPDSAQNAVGDGHFSELRYFFHFLFMVGRKMRPSKLYRSCTRLLLRRISIQTLFESRTNHSGLRPRPGHSSSSSGWRYTSHQRCSSSCIQASTISPPIANACSVPHHQWRYGTSGRRDTVNQQRKVSLRVSVCW